MISKDSINDRHVADGASSTGQKRIWSRLSASASALRLNMLSNINAGRKSSYFTRYLRYREVGCLMKMTSLGRLARITFDGYYSTSSGSKFFRAYSFTNGR
jgi:hypothetical protein